MRVTKTKIVLALAIARQEVEHFRSPIFSRRRRREKIGEDCRNAYPALKGWAIIGRPYGTGIRRLTLFAGTPQDGLACLSHFVRTSPIALHLASRPHGGQAGTLASRPSGWEKEVWEAVRNLPKDSSFKLRHSSFLNGVAAPLARANWAGSRGLVG